MKINRYKKAHRILSFYQHSFGFRPPFQLLLDGTFCQKALQQKVDIRLQVTKYFGNEVKFLTTACVLNEVENLGPLLYGALQIIKQFPLRSCGHERKPISASRCLHSLVDKQQDREHYIIATQDEALIGQLRKRYPNCPILTLLQNVMTLMKPQKEATRIADEKTREEMVEDEQLKELEVLKKLEFGETAVKKRKRKGPKQPNPLSCLKKKRKSNEEPLTSSETNPSNAKRKRKRNRNKSSNIPLVIDKVVKSLS